MAVKSPDSLHLIFCQFEIKDIIILRNVVRIRGSRDGNKPCLDLPPKDNLGRRLSVFVSQLFDHFIPKVFGSMAPASERIPGFDHDIVLTNVILQFCILIVQVVFILDDRRRDRGKRQYLVNLLFRVII